VLGPGAVNTHYFDGNIKYAIEILQPDIERIAKIRERRQGYQQIFKMVKVQRPYPTVLSNLNQIINAYQAAGRTEKSPNYDPVNKLYACDLLYLVYEKIYYDENDEYMDLLICQLEEMSTGMCPQGRTTRLIQILVMLRDDLTPTSK